MGEIQLLEPSGESALLEDAAGVVEDGRGRYEEHGAYPRIGSSFLHERHDFPFPFGELVGDAEGFGRVVEEQPRLEAADEEAGDEAGDGKGCEEERINAVTEGQDPEGRIDDPSGFADYKELFRSQRRFRAFERALLRSHRDFR